MANKVFKSKNIKYFTSSPLGIIALFIIIAYLLSVIAFRQDLNY